jgi:hypothetical protein
MTCLKQSLKEIVPDERINPWTLLPKDPKLRKEYMISKEKMVASNFNMTFWPVIVFLFPISVILVLIQSNYSKALVILRTVCIILIYIFGKRSTRIVYVSMFLLQAIVLTYLCLDLIYGTEPEQEGDTSFKGVPAPLYLHDQVFAQTMVLSIAFSPNFLFGFLGYGSLYLIAGTFL